MIILSILLVSVSASWVAVSQLVKTRAAIPVLIPLPDALIASPDIWHDYHCDGCQPISPQPVTISKATIFRWLGPENRSKLMSIVEKFVLNNDNFSIVSPPLSFLPTCCDQFNKQKVLYIMAKSEDLYLCYEPRQGEDNIYISLVRNSHCAAPPFAPLKTPIHISTPSNAIWPKHWHAWISHPHDNMRVIVPKHSNPFWPPTELPWRPKVTHPIVKVAERLFTSVPIWVYSEKQLNKIHDISKGVNIELYSNISSPVVCLKPHLDKHQCPLPTIVDCKLEHMQDHICPITESPTDSTQESQTVCQKCERNHNLDEISPCEKTTDCDKSHCGKEKLNCLCKISIVTGLRDKIEKLEHDLANIDNPAEATCRLQHCDEKVNNCKCKTAQINSFNNMHKSVTDRLRAQIKAAEAGCTKAHCAFDNHCHTCKVDAGCLDCQLRIPEIVEDCEENHCGEAIHCHKCLFDPKCEQCLARVPGVGTTKPCELDHCSPTSNGCECKTTIFEEFKATHARVVKTLTQDIEDAKICNKQHCDENNHCHICKSSINCEDCMTVIEGGPDVQLILNYITPDQAIKLLNIPKEQFENFLDNPDLGQSTCDKMHILPSLIDDFDIVESTIDNLKYGDFICDACRSRHFAPESIGCAAENIKTTLGNKLVAPSRDNPNIYLINWLLLINNNQTTAIPEGMLGRSNFKREDVYINEEEMPPLLAVALAQYRTKRNSKDLYYYRLPQVPTVKLHLIVTLLGHGKFFIGTLPSDKANTFLSAVQR